MQLAATAFKTKCLNLIDQVYQSRKEIIITKHGKPMDPLSPFRARKKKWAKQFGRMAGTVTFLGDIIEPIGEIWNAQK